MLSDDIRMHSGISTMSRELVLGCVHKYDFVQVAAAQKHPEEGKVFDMSDAVNKEKNITDSYVKLYPTSGYGNPDLIRRLIKEEEIDVILHFTDPRFWTWLYNIEREIRQQIPITYLNIWDNIPAPMWNRPFYMSCDALFSISKQTYNINKIVLGEDCWVSSKDVKSKDDLKGKSLLHYVPHGINEDVFKPLDKNDSKLLDFKKKIFGNKEYEYVLFYNNRNIGRKRVSDIILAYRSFCDSLPKKESDKCCLLLHTAKVDPSGTDLPAVIEALCPDYNIVFSTNKLAPFEMNMLYNISDVVVNNASNEGFGLSHAEGLMAGRVLINNVTGGLQDGANFMDDDGNAVEFTDEWGSNHDGRYKKCGKWVKPVFPAARQIHGSPATPYLFDDHTRWEDFAEAIMYWYLKGPEERTECGQAGREFAMGDGGLNSKNMSKQLILGMETTLNNWTPRSKFSIHTDDEYHGHTYENGCGVIIPPVNIEKIKEEISNE